MVVVVVMMQQALRFGQVRLFVRLEDGGARERLAAHVARKGPLAGVHPAVVLHVVTQLERLAAVVAAERALLAALGRRRRRCRRRRLAPE